jgi:hypothetical protein
VCNKLVLSVVYTWKKVIVVCFNLYCLETGTSRLLKSMALAVKFYSSGSGAVAGSAAAWDPTVWGPRKRLVVFQILCQTHCIIYIFYFAFSGFSAQVCAEVGPRGVAGAGGGGKRCRRPRQQSSSGGQTNILNKKKKDFIPSRNITFLRQTKRNF